MQDACHSFQTWTVEIDFNSADVFDLTEFTKNEKKRRAPVPLPVGDGDGEVSDIFDPLPDVAAAPALKGLEGIIQKLESKYARLEAGDDDDDEDAAVFELAGYDSDDPFVDDDDLNKQFSKTRCTKVINEDGDVVKSCMVVRTVRHDGGGGGDDSDSHALSRLRRQHRQERKIAKKEAREAKRMAAEAGGGVDGGGGGGDRDDEAAEDVDEQDEVDVDGGDEAEHNDVKTEVADKPKEKHKHKKKKTQPVGGDVGGDAPVGVDGDAPVAPPEVQLPAPIVKVDGGDGGHKISRPKPNVYKGPLPDDITHGIQRINNVIETYRLFKNGKPHRLPQELMQPLEALVVVLDCQWDYMSRVSHELTKIIPLEHQSIKKHLKNARPRARTNAIKSGTF